MVPVEAEERSTRGIEALEAQMRALGRVGIEMVAIVRNMVTPNSASERMLGDLRGNPIAADFPADGRVPDS